MTILVLAETADGRLMRDATARAVAALAPLGAITLLVADAQTGQAAREAATIKGVSQVLSAEAPALAHQRAEPLAALIASLAEHYAIIAAPATSTAKNVMPRLAALLDVMVISDVTTIDGPDQFARPIYAGNAIQTVKSSDRIKVLTIRTSGFAAAGEGPAASITPVPVPEEPEGSAWIADQLAASDRPELTSARIVVSGGRGVGSRQDFTLIEGLADRLGAAVGASRAAVDSGFAPNDWQVGQTGKVVAPELYIACGISGAIQHLAGMKDSKIIVAINKDEDAPIFQIADYGLVADLFEAVPELERKL
ncbi:electron transfer flavoprotein subunit alpha/FixB family protein [Martelella alba]|uniref:Electron transfer flavoprotein subunit alpha n=1 Tax=Martelella alba TaxID=2590451 RepID=A0A506UBB2_9HYPH|nr:electron transfer flavoprotein subunit alpha/FixB family protein [Martelella alba]TPW29087.1 electron transfer flavoprotein subunit alpha/FixB family protein [Martelella alba]